MTHWEIETCLEREEKDLLNMKKLVEYLKNDLEARIDACGDDEIGRAHV